MAPQEACSQNDSPTALQNESGLVTVPDLDKRTRPQKRRALPRLGSCSETPRGSASSAAVPVSPPWRPPGWLAPARERPAGSSGTGRCPRWTPPGRAEGYVRNWSNWHASHASGTPFGVYKIKISTVYLKPGANLNIQSECACLDVHVAEMCT